MRENVFRDQVIEHAHRLGHRVYCVLDSRVPAKRTLKGWPDLTIIRRGPGRIDWWQREAYAELKDATDKASADQILVLDMLASLDGCEHVYLWRPNDWDGVAAWLEWRVPFAPARWIGPGRFDL